MAERDEIEEVKRRADLVREFEQYVTLKRAGSSLKGLCPFHNEKTPSFHVNPSIGLWTCYGCSESGDVFTFLQKIENLTFFETLERLALRYGVTLTKKNGQSDGGNTGPSERDRIHRVNFAALKYFQESLQKTPAAQQYVANRGISGETVGSFFVGYAPDSFDGLISALSAQRIPMADAELAGLVGRSDYGKLYDRMRGRVVFPILDVQERPIAFGGRLIGESKEGQPKYWNSPETPAFLKRNTLYGLWRARKAIADFRQAIVVEGYTDVVAAHQAGFNNVVATLGTSLTPDHVRTLKRLAPSVVLAFDGDSAGLKAAFRASEIFSAEEVEVRVMELPPGEDPDSLLRANRVKEFSDAVAGAVSMSEYRVRRLLRLSPSVTKEDRLELLKKAIPILADVHSIVEREGFIQMVAEYHPQVNLGSAFAADQVRQDVRIFMETRSGVPVDEGRGNDAPEPVIVSGRSSVELAEQQILRALFSEDAVLLDTVRGMMKLEEFPEGAVRPMVAAAYAIMESGVMPRVSSAINDQTGARELHAAAVLLLNDSEPMSQALVEQAILYIKNKAREKRLAVLNELISGGSSDESAIREFIRLNAELKGTKSVRTMVSG